MILRKKLLANSLLYAVIGKGCFTGRSISGYLNKLKRHKIVDIVQLRYKGGSRREAVRIANQINRELSGSRILFIVNDYIEIAKITGCDGIHLGQGDISVKTARSILGIDKIIGVSCHNLNQALSAQRQGADYISIGPIFKTPAKPKIKPLGLGNLRKISRYVHVPFFAIGGISKDNISFVAAAGAKRVAFIRAINQSADIRRLLLKQINI